MSTSSDPHNNTSGRQGTSSPQGTPVDPQQNPMTVFAEAFTKFMQSGPLQSSASPRTPRAKGTMLAEFLKLKPPTFNGNTDPIAAESWLKDIETLFELLPEVTDEASRVRLAAHMLLDDAKFWWQSVKERQTKDYEFEWADFRTQFLEKYFPDTLRGGFE